MVVKLLMGVVVLIFLIGVIFVFRDKLGEVFGAILGRFRFG